MRNTSFIIFSVIPGLVAAILWSGLAVGAAPENSAQAWQEESPPVYLNGDNPYTLQMPTGSEIYVDKDVSGGSNNGSSWENAYSDLQNALAAASFGNEIWVAEGVYLPAGPGGARTSSFQLRAGVALYGGFDGSETSREQRDWGSHLSVLSGDLNGNDEGFTNNDENVYHVVSSDGLTETAVLDGFTIRAGYADGEWPQGTGGGMYNYNSDPTVTNCIFSGNKAVVRGGGMHNLSGSDPRLTNIIFRGNYSDGDAAGMQNHTYSSPTLYNVDFITNTACFSGGGIDNYFYSNPTLINVSFIGNTAIYGGGMRIYHMNQVKMSNAIFRGNTAGLGGGIYLDGEGSHVFNNITLSGNTASTSSGGGIYNSDSNAMIANSVIWGNTGGEVSGSTSKTIIQYSLVQGGYAGTGNINQDPLFVDADGADNTAGTPDDDLRLQANSPAIDAGDNSRVMTDTLDLDEDGNSSERVPYDRDGSLRFTDTPYKADTGAGAAPVVDMGAYEAWYVVYVDGDAAGLNNGSSWGNALRMLQGGLEAAGRGDEVWVAEGVYTPTEKTNPSDGRTATFQLKGGVGIYGGFAGGETERGQREWWQHESRLSGDIGDQESNADNSYHVVSSSGVTATAVLDGFTITGGYANGSSPHDAGGGMLNQSNGNPTIANSAFISNTARYGGGIYNNTSSPLIGNATFSGNIAQDFGGGIYNNASNLTLANVTLSGNKAASGGGIYNLESNPTIANSIIWGNTGGQIYNLLSAPVVRYSLVQGGYAGTGNINQDPLFVDADGADNTAGTPDDDLRLQANSPAIDAGDNSRVMTDTLDLDEDGNSSERVPYDRDGSLRFTDTPYKADTGAGAAPVVDMGAYEAWYVVYVDGDAAGLENGASWSNALRRLGAGLEAAGRGDEVWVAEGVYTPTEKTNPSDGRTATFQLKGGVGIYGGFAGGETERGQREWWQHESKLSGNIGDQESNADNSYHVVSSSGVTATAALDGFTITGGYANGTPPHNTGGGMLNENDSRPTVTNDIFEGNFATYGGGMHNDGAQPTIVNTVFRGNTALYGGGLSNDESNPVSANLIFSGNSAGYGGGVFNDNSAPSLTNMTVYGNTAGVDLGGGVYNQNSSTPLIVNSIFWGNSGGQINNQSSSPAVDFCLVEGGYPGGTNIITSDPLFVDANGADDTAGNADDDLHLQIDSPAIDAGDNSAVITDTIDMDGDENRSERLPYDLDLVLRFVDVPGTDTGSGTAPIVDMGAYETVPEYIYLPLILR